MSYLSATSQRGIMIEMPNFERKDRTKLRFLVASSVSVALLVACGSRFTSGDQAASAGATSAGGERDSTTGGGYAGRISATGGGATQPTGSGGSTSVAGSSEQAGNDPGSQGGSPSHAGASANGGALVGSGGTLVGVGGTLVGAGGTLVGAGGTLVGTGGIGTLATAGTGGSNVITGGSSNWSPCTPALMIDDMEDGNDRNCPNQGRNGEWWASTGTTTGSIDPPKTGEFPAYALGSDARVHSSYGMRLSGKGFGHTDADWASIGFNLIDNSSYDLTPYQGLAFYAKSKAGTVTVHVEFATDSTTATSEGGACQSKCNDHWSKSVSVDGTWRELTVPFSSLAQEGWGVQPKDLAHARFIFFGFLGTDGGPAAFDYLIDDVRLY